MASILEGFLSCICVASSSKDLDLISKFCVDLAVLHDKFEVIVCAKPNSIDGADMEKFCQQSPSLAIYEISASTNDALFTAGLERALGDWILELPSNFTLFADTKELTDLFSHKSGQKMDSYQLVPQKSNLTDYILSKLTSAALEVPVYTMTYMPRLTKRTSLQTWNIRKLRHKVIRVAPQLDRGEVMVKYTKITSNKGQKRLLRVGLRTIAHSSAKPLRWVSFFSLIGAGVSIVVSFTVLIIGIDRKAVPGWTTTNLQIGGLSFLILLVLGVLAEYVYQIAAASIDQPAFRIVREYISPRFVFDQMSNIARFEASKGD